MVHLERRIHFGIFVLILALTLLACGLGQTVAAVPKPTISASGDYITYTVQAGDTVSLIATRFSLTVEQLIALNVDRYPALARDPSLLQMGWQLRVPNRLTSASARATATAEAELPLVDVLEATRQVVDGINTARAQRGLTLLRTDAALTRIANDRSTDMIARDYFSHFDPQTGQEPLLRYLQATKFSYQYAGENIAEIKNDVGWVPPLLTVAARYGATDLANEFVRGWLNSQEHRVNIFNPRYHRTGVALSVSSNGRRIVATQVFSD